MSDPISISQIADRNSKAAVSLSEKTRDDLTERVNKLEALVHTLNQDLFSLNHKYILLLTKNFNGGSTSAD